MSSSKWLVLVVLAAAAPARAQDGFALERFNPSPAGAGWLAMDALDMHGAIGGAGSFTIGYARDPLAPLVTDEAFADVGGAITWDRFRLSLDLASPVAIDGSAVAVDLGHDPDVIVDPRVGFDVRFFGDAAAPLRLGWSAQLFAPSGTRANYESDETPRAMFRLLFAGDLPHFAYAGFVGAHVRRFDQGDELVFGLAAGARLGVPHWSFVIGPEVFGETAFGDFFGSATGLEGLLSARAETTRATGPNLRVKLGGGAGLDPNFGAPAWRLVAGIEVFGRH